MLDVKFSHKEQVAKDIYSFWFESQTPVKFVAGQFIELFLPHVDADDRGEKRWFTLSSAPEDKLLSITTKVIKDCSSFKKNLTDLTPGTMLKIASPMGDFVLPKDTSMPLLFVAGGIGCTPFHSILKHLQNTGQKRNIKMLYAAREMGDVVFQDTFESLGKDFEVILSEPPPEWAGLKGKLNAKTICEYGKDRQIYISGPEPMVEILVKDLADLGVSKSRTHGDYFPGYQPI